jgi:TonB-dependent receptor
MRAIQRTAASIAAALICSPALFAQTAPAPAAAEKKEEKKDDKQKLDTVTVSGKRAALASAQLIKQNADEIVDSIVADDIGKLPDRSVTEVLQRIVGVAIDRTMAKNDPEHHSVEGSGVIIRGLSYVRSELNGRDSFSANGGRGLNFEDVPPELMAGVDVFKNPSAERIEGAVSGLVNLRTALPFDHAGLRGAVSLSGTRSQLLGKNTGSASAQISNRWSTDAGEFGALINIASSDSATRTDAFQVEPYYPRSNIVNGQTVWIPKGAQWRTLEFERERKGLYGALQWRKNDISSSLTYFKSDYKMAWAERAIFAQSNPYNITLDPGATFDGQGALLTGTMRAPADGGINYGADTRGSQRDSETTDIGWNIAWKASDRWSFSTDLQLIKAKTASFDSTVATGVQMPKQRVDLSGGLPQLLFDEADRAHLANPANYYWAFTMEHLDRSKAESKAWRADAKFNFDHAVLQDLRFGVRLTDREANTTDTAYNWAAITQPWMAWWYLAPGSLARLNDPRFSGDTHTHSFNNFFGGKTAMPPSLIFPDVSLVNGYPQSYAKLHGYAKTLCTEFNNGNSAPCFDFWNARNPEDPQYQNQQKERTQAAYGQLRFDFEDLGLDGTLGLRVVRTEAEAQGYTVFTRTLPTIPPGANVVGSIPNIPSFSEAEDSKQNYTNVLPSLNLRLKGGDGLQYRLALARAISRPDFTQLQGYTTLSQSFDSRTVTDGNGNTTVFIDRVNHTGEAKGNPLLKPVTSDQLDVTAEWYFAKAGSFTAAAFYKNIKDVIVNQTRIRKQADTAGTLHDFLVTAPINGAKGSATGIELSFQRYFDMLPGALSGLGIQANYTYVDSKTKLYTPVTQAYCAGGNNAANLNLNLNGCDTDGRTFGDLPLPQLSKNTFNLALLYDHGPWSARLAYSWRSKYLQAVNVNGTNGGDGTDSNPASPTFGQTNVAWALPTWGDDYGQLDGGVHFRFDSGLSIGLEAQNLNNAVSRQLMQQHIGYKGRAWFASGRRYTLQASYSF